MTRFCELDQSSFAPFFITNIHRLGNPVGKEHDYVPGFMKKYVSLIPLWEKPDHWTAGFQAQHVAHAAAVPQDHGRVVTSVDVGQASCDRIVLGIKQGRVATRCRCLANKAIDSPHQVRGVSED